MVAHGRTLLGLVALLLLIAGPVPGAAASDLERARIDRPSGIAPGLAAGGGRARVRIVAGAQPVLRAALGARLRTLLRPGRGSAKPFAGPAIDGGERARARRNEAGFEAATATLTGEIRTERRILHRIAAAVRRRGGRAIDFETSPAALVAAVGRGRLRALARLQEVAAIEAAPRPRPLSGIGTTAVGAPSWWAAGFTGGRGFSDMVPADAAIEGEAVDPAHPAFAGIVVDNDPSQAVTDHGNHTGGVLASGDSTYPGVAKGIDRLIGSGSTAYELGLDTPGEPGAADPAEIINISFGSAASSDDEDNTDDVLTAVFGVGQTFGAGNDNVDGTPTVGNIGRNVLTVGGFNDVGTVTSTDDVVLGISSRGPTPGGRKKPDLTAPAGAVIAPSAAWNSPPSNPDFTAMTGTSFAAPHVAGAMTLLEGAGIGDPMAQRAILINSARDWDGEATGLAGWAPPQVGWRPEVGWGELDLAAALADRGNYALGAVRAGEAAYYSATPAAGEKATLAYELRGYFVGFPDPGTQTFVYTQSNLDLHQYGDDGSEIMPPAAPAHGGGPDAIDPNDTVEQVRAPGGPPGEVIYKVEAASTVEGAEAEPFAIAAAQPLTPLEPAVARPTGVSVSPSGPVRCGQPVTITAAATNDSDDLAAASARIELALPAGLELVAGPAEQIVSGGTLEPQETSEQRAWTVKVVSDGSKQARLTGSGGALGTEFSRESTVAIHADCDPPGTSIEAGPADPTNAEAPRFRFSSPGGASDFECAVDGSSYEPCSSPAALPGLGEGGHRFSVRAFDAAGNRDPSPATAEFTVDRSVSGAGLRAASTRLRDGGRRAGSVRVRLGEAGTAKVTARANVGKRKLRLRGRVLELAGPGHARVRLMVPRRDRRPLRRAVRRGRPVEVRARARFTDQLGNRAVAVAAFDLRR